MFSGEIIPTQDLRQYNYFIAPTGLYPQRYCALSVKIIEGSTKYTFKYKVYLYSSLN